MKAITALRRNEYACLNTNTSIAFSSLYGYFPPKETIDDIVEELVSQFGHSALSNTTIYLHLKSHQSFRRLRGAA